MVHRKHRRTQPRFKCLVPAVILRETTRMPSSVLMQNFSDGGFYFEVSGPLDPGELIMVRADDSSVIDPVNSGTWDPRLAEIKWCMGIGTENDRRYGCCAQYM